MRRDGETPARYALAGGQRGPATINRAVLGVSALERLGAGERPGLGLLPLDQGKQTSFMLRLLLAKLGKGLTEGQKDISASSWRTRSRETHGAVSLHSTW
jgi:hypothetical protein